MGREGGKRREGKGHPIFANRSPLVGTYKCPHTAGSSIHSDVMIGKLTNREIYLKAYVLTHYQTRAGFGPRPIAVTV